MKYTDISREQWIEFQYTHKMSELENFLLRMIVKFYEKDPSNAEDAFSGLYNHICSKWLDQVEDEMYKELESPVRYYVLQDSRGMRVVPWDEMLTSPDAVWYSSELEVECHAFIQQFCDSYDSRDSHSYNDYGELNS